MLAKGRELLYRTAGKADIVCEIFTPGTAARFGYGCENFRAVREDIIMMSLSMQGQTGPRADQPGLGNHLQAMSGLDYLTGFPEGRPQGPNQVLPDFIGPWMAIASLICALEHRHRTGEGQHLDISQREAIMLYLQPALIEYGVTGVSPERRGNGSPIDAPHGVYPGKGRERWIAIVVTSDIEWRALHELLPNAMRKRFSTNAPAQERLARQEELDAALAAWTAGHDPGRLVLHAFCREPAITCTAVMVRKKRFLVIGWMPDAPTPRAGRRYGHPARQADALWWSLRAEGFKRGVLNSPAGIGRCGGRWPRYARC